MTDYDDIELRSPGARFDQVREHIGEDKFAQLTAALYNLTVLHDRQVAEDTDDKPIDVAAILEALDNATTVGLDRTLDSTEDVLRAIERERALKSHNKSKFSDPGGRPSKVERVVHQIDIAQRLYLMNEDVDQEYVHGKALESLRAADPSRPTYYKIRDRIANHDYLPYSSEEVDEWRETAGVAKPS